MKKVKMLILISFAVMLFGCKDTIVEPVRSNLTGYWKSTEYNFALRIFQNDVNNFSVDVFINNKIHGTCKTGIILNDQLSFTITTTLSYEHFMFNFTGILTGDVIKGIVSGDLPRQNMIVGFGEIGMTLTRGQ
jgi:hypothetical protein